MDLLQYYINKTAQKKYSTMSDKTILHEILRVLRFLSKAIIYTFSSHRQYKSSTLCYFFCIITDNYILLVCLMCIP